MTYDLHLRCHTLTLRNSRNKAANRIYTRKNHRMEDGIANAGVLGRGVRYQIGKVKISVYRPLADKLRGMHKTQLHITKELNFGVTGSPLPLRSSMRAGDLVSSDQLRRHADLQTEPAPITNTVGDLKGKSGQWRKLEDFVSVA